MGISWSSSTSQKSLASFSQISTRFYCDNCFTRFNQVSWIKCNQFDLCEECGKLEDDKLRPEIRQERKKIFQEKNITDLTNTKEMPRKMVGDAEEALDEITDEKLEDGFRCIMNQHEIRNDLEMAIVMDVLQKERKMSREGKKILLSEDLALLLENERPKLDSMIVKYHMPADNNTIRILSLDGGGVRGYMSVKVVCQLIEDNYLPDMEPPDPKDEKNKKEDNEYHENFKKGQDEFISQFDYFAGTSAGGLIAFCLATGYPLSKIRDIYEKPRQYFIKKGLNKLPWKFSMIGNVISAKYNPEAIHNEIERIIKDSFMDFGNGKLTSENATLLDLHNFLNPDHMIDDRALKLNRQYHGHLLEFVDKEPSTTDSKVRDCNQLHEPPNRHFVQREKVLLITAYNTTENCITVFNTSNEKYWGYRIADVLKATMAAPTYFETFKIKEKKINGNFVRINKPEIFIDGGVFANDPELIALWAIQMQWKKSISYRLLSIGTGCSNLEFNSDNWGGYWAWVGKKPSGLVVQTLMEATRSLTETVMTHLATFNNIRRMKFNYILKNPMDLDDPEFVNVFNQDINLENDPDYNALKYFYKKHIIKDQN